MGRAALQGCLKALLQDSLANRGKVVIHTQRQRRKNISNTMTAILEYTGCDTVPFTFGATSDILTTAYFSTHLYPGEETNPMDLEGVCEELIETIFVNLPTHIVIKKAEAKALQFEKETQQYKAVLHFAFQYVEGR